jgi:hypothetical protein
MRVGIAALLGLYFTVNGGAGAVYEARRGHWVVSCIALTAALFFAVCSVALVRSLLRRRPDRT